MKGLVSDKEYFIECQRLLKNYNNIKDNIPNFEGIEKFSQVFLSSLIEFQHQPNNQHKEDVIGRQNRFIKGYESKRNCVLFITINSKKWQWI